MRKIALLAIPVLAVLAAAGIVAAQPYLNPQDMPQEEKALTLQMLEHKQQMTGDQIAFLNGQLTEEQFQERLAQHSDSMFDLMDQYNEQFGGSGAWGCPMAGGNGFYGRGFGARMRGMGYGMMW